MIINSHVSILLLTCLVDVFFSKEFSFEKSIILSFPSKRFLNRSIVSGTSLNKYFIFARLIKQFLKKLYLKN